MERPESKRAMKDALADFMSEGGRGAAAGVGGATTEAGDRSGSALSSAYGEVVASYGGKPVAGGAPASDPTPAGKQQLVDAYDKLVEHEASRPVESISFDQPVPAWRRYGVPILGALAFVATAYLWIARPKWLYPDFDSPAPPADAATAQRALIAGSIIMQNFHATQGRYPANFGDAGVNLPWMSVVPTSDGGFSLMTDAASGRLRMQSTPGVPPRIEGLSR